MQHTTVRVIFQVTLHAISISHLRMMKLFKNQWFWKSQNEREQWLFMFSRYSVLINEARSKMEQSSSWDLWGWLQYHLKL